MGATSRWRLAGWQTGQLSVPLPSQWERLGEGTSRPSGIIRRTLMPNATINDFHIHYERGGSGPLLILLHGIGSNARSWQHQLQGLADEYDVVAWDMRGYGSSSDPIAPYTMQEVASDLAGLLDHLGFEKAHV